MRRDGGSEEAPGKLTEGLARGIPPGVFSYVWQIKDFKSFVFVSVASKGLAGAFFVSVAGKGLSGWKRLFTKEITTDYIDCQEQIQRWVRFQNGKNGRWAKGKAGRAEEKRTGGPRDGRNGTRRYLGSNVLAITSYSIEI